MADRTGHRYGARVPLDEQIPGDRSLDPGTDNPCRLALAWLAARPACTGSVSAAVR